MHTIETVEQLEKLYARYPITGAFAVADTGDVTFWRKDAAGNKLIVTLSPGQPIQYEEFQSLPRSGPSGLSSSYRGGI